MNDLTVGHRFIANYVKHDKVLFRLIVEGSVTKYGWERIAAVQSATLQALAFPGGQRYDATGDPWFVFLCRNDGILPVDCAGSDDP